MSRKTGSLNLMTKLRQQEPSEIQKIRADNERLRSERDEANLFRERNRVALNRRDSDLQAHKAELESLRKAEGTMCAEIDLCHAALEKARVALWHVEKYLGFCSHPIVLTVKEALATINELLQKGSK